VSAPRGYRAEIRGFDFDHVFVRARSNSSARLLVARGFEEAGFGNVCGGFRHIVSVKLDARADTMPLCCEGDEGLCKVVRP
jgi:hypothetical protein